MREMFWRVGNKVSGSWMTICIIGLALLCGSVMAQENSAEDWIKKGDDLYSVGSHKEAIEAYDRALEIDPAYGNAWRGKGYSFGARAVLNENLSDCKESLKAFDKAIDLIPADDFRDLALAWEGKAISLNRMGNILDDTGNQEAAKGKRKEALNAYDKAIELDPDFTGIEAQLYRAGVVAELGMLNESVADYDKILEIMAINDTMTSYVSIVWTGKGEVLEKMDRNEDALKAFDRALELDPTSAMAWEGKVDALRSLGRNSDADAVLAKASDLGVAVDSGLE